MTQGDLSVEDYCKMKITNIVLRNVGQPIPDGTLIFNLLHGINQLFSTTADFVAGQKDMKFSTALDQLALKELHLANEDNVAASTALVASTPSTSCSSACRSSSTPATAPAAAATAPQEAQQLQWRRPVSVPFFPCGPVDLFQPMGRSGRMAGQQPGCWVTCRAL